MENPFNFQLRKPFYGIVPPGSQVAFTVSPPITTEEAILVVATRPGEVTFTTPRPDAIMVVSRAKVPVGFGVMVVPTSVMGPNASLWNRIAESVRTWWQSRRLG